MADVRAMLQSDGGARIDDYQNNRRMLIRPHNDPYLSIEHSELCNSIECEFYGLTLAY